MSERWIPYFLGALKAMEYCGNIGASRNVTLFSDGDGDFHPKFNWDNLPSPIDLKNQLNSTNGIGCKGFFFDAG